MITIIDDHGKRWKVKSWHSTCGIGDNILHEGREEIVKIKSGEQGFRSIIVEPADPEPPQFAVGDRVALVYNEKEYIGYIEDKPIVIDGILKYPVGHWSRRPMEPIFVPAKELVYHRCDPEPPREWEKSLRELSDYIDDAFAKVVSGVREKDAAPGCGILEFRNEQLLPTAVDVSKVKIIRGELNRHAKETCAVVYEDGSIDRCDEPAADLIRRWKLVLKGDAE